MEQINTNNEFLYRVYGESPVSQCLTYFTLLGTNEFFLEKIKNKKVDRYTQLKDSSGRNVFINDIYVNEENNYYLVTRGEYKIGHMKLYGDYLKNLRSNGIDENIGYVCDCKYAGNIWQDKKLYEKLTEG